MPYSTKLYEADSRKPIKIGVVVSIEESPVSEVVCTDGKAELGNDKEDWEII